MGGGIVEEHSQSSYCDVKPNAARCPRIRSSDACEVSPGKAGLKHLCSAQSQVEWMAWSMETQ